MKHSLLKSDLCRLVAVFATVFLGLAGAFSQTPDLVAPGTNTTAYFDLSQGFSTAANPAGPWAFGWKESITSSNLTVITYGKSFTAENGVPIFAWLEADDKQPSVSKVIGPGLAISAEGQFQALPGTIYVTAGEDDTPRNFVVVRFTVPLNGTYLLLADVRDMFDGSFQGDTDFHITRNQVEFFSRALPPHATATASNYLALAAGDQIEFLVGRGEDGHRENSGVKLAATLTRIGSTPPPPLPPGSFDLSANFSLTSNPAGPWSYGRLAGLTGPFELLPNTRTFGAENGVPIGIWYREANHKPWAAKVLGPGTAISYEFNSPAGTVYFGADPDSDPADFGAVRFTVPDGRGGTYRLMTSVRSLYDNARSTDTDFHVLRNGQELFSHLVPANSGIAYSNVFILAAGDRIDFAAGRGSGDPNSGLKIQATLTPFFSGTNVPPRPPRPPPVAVNAFDLSRDFSLASNPNGAWRYGYLTELGGSFGLLQAPRTFTADNGVPISVWELSLYQLPIVAKVMGPDTAHSDGTHFTAAPGTIYFAPGADNAPENYGVIRFVVPPDKAGQYRLETSVQSLFDFDRSRDADFHVLKNGDELFGQFLPPNSGTGYSNTLFLAAGDTIDFAIGRGADGTTSDTGLKIQATLTPLTITPPPPTPALSFDLSTDFSLDANPNGVWSYGYLTQLGGTFGFLGSSRTFSADNGVPIGGWELSLFNLPFIGKVLGPETAHSDGDHFTGPAGTVYFAPGADDSPQNFGAIRFTVPANRGGQYRLVTSVASLFDFDRSRDADFHVLRNGEELFGQFLEPNSTAAYSNTLALAAGDTIDFAIGKGADGTTSDTGLKIAASLSYLLTNAPPTPALQSFDLSTGFSTAANPSGAWSFGWKETIVSSNFEVLTFGKSFTAENGVPIFAWLEANDRQPSVSRVMGPEVAVSADGQFVAEPGTVYFTAGDDESPRNFGVIRFTVPPTRGGVYRLTASVRDLFDGFHQGDTDFHIARNGVGFYSRQLPPHSTAGVTNIIMSLAGGEHIEFLVGRGADGHQAGSGLKIAARLTLLTNAPPPPLPGTNCVVIAGMAASWSFNGQVQDSVSGTALHLSGTPEFSPGKVGQALQFDGTNDQAVAAASTSLNVGMGNGFSIEAWVNPAHVTMQPIAEWSANPASSGAHFWIGVYGSGSLFANLVDTGGSSHSWRSDTDIVLPNQWQHVAMSYEKASGLLRFYLNGQKVTEHALGSFEPQTSYPLAIGFRREQEHFNGSIDELAIYRRVLSDAEFAAIHAAGSFGKCRRTPLV
ncbi:MAG TPA: LamG domain-containing protein, partial [Verrucomicrobiae bacterium]|nr:LamG domain-containing protein [Verrucomicrobiae bacterium]